MIKSAAGTIDVARFLKDLEDSIELVERSAEIQLRGGSEVTALLRCASDVERRYLTREREAVYGPGRFTYTQDKVGTRYVLLIVRTLANPDDPADNERQPLQDAIG